MDSFKRVHFYLWRAGLVLAFVLPAKIMEYISLDSYQHYSECSKIVEEMGFHLVELKISPQKGVTQIQSVVACKDSSENISVNDCAKVHRVLLEKLEELLGTDNLSMELSSPGMERNIKNAAEFPFFVGRKIRVWDKETTDWERWFLPTKRRSS